MGLHGMITGRSSRAGIEFENGCWNQRLLSSHQGKSNSSSPMKHPIAPVPNNRSPAFAPLTAARPGSSRWRSRFRPGHRDGMPVPLLLDGGQHIALAIEDNGLAGTIQAGDNPPFDNGKAQRASCWS